MEDGGAGPEVPAVVERFVKQLYITAQAVRLHPAAGNIPKERAAALLAVLKAAQQRLADVALRFTADAISYGGSEVFPGTEAYARFASEFHGRGVAAVRFHVGATADELIEFLGVLVMTPGDVRDAGGFAARLWELGVADVTVSEIAAGVAGRVAAGEVPATGTSLEDDAEAVSPGLVGQSVPDGDPATADADATAVERVVTFAAAVTPARAARVLEALRAEARHGIDEGDSLGTLVAIAVQEDRQDRFAEIMRRLDTDIGRLIEGRHFEAAAEAADVLSAALEDPERPDNQRLRLRSLSDELTGPAAIENIAAAMRSAPEGSREMAACRRLLSRATASSVDRLIAILAGQSDPAARRALVDVLAQAARGHADTLSRWIGDPRWYLVRNVVTALGRTKDPAALPALTRAARYPEARVRREAVRALSALHDPRVGPVLVGVLDDEDAGIVQLAARALGAKGEAAAVPALTRVASGEGRGSRETGPRVEAIEALGRIGSREPLGLLRSLARRGPLRRLGGKGELSPAAQRAIAAIEARGDVAKPAEGPPGADHAAGPGAGDHAGSAGS